LVWETHGSSGRSQKGETHGMWAPGMEEQQPAVGKVLGSMGSSEEPPSPVLERSGGCIRSLSPGETNRKN